MSGAVKVVCVTGASGYIASWLVKLLLERGYTVRATVRSLDDPSKTEHLLALDGAKERLHLFKANLLDEGSFDYVVDGCDGVFHTASPVYLSVNDPQAELIEPAVKGTLNVLRSCAKVPTLKRVVVTSSMTSVSFNGKPLNSDVVLDETWFSDPEFCEQSKLWYPLSKLLAEEAARKFAKENGIDLVMMNPGYVIGPLLQPTLNLSSEGILDLIKSGKELFSTGIYRCVDVRDVAYAHIQAFEIPSARGRYCIVGTTTYSSEVLKIVNKLYPALNLSEKEKGNVGTKIVFTTSNVTRINEFYNGGEIKEMYNSYYGNLYNKSTCKDEKSVVPPYHVSKEKAKSLGVDFIPLELSLKDTIESLKEKNFLSF